MNLEKLNEIMNCECLQCIIKNDEDKHNIDNEYLDEKVIQNSLDVDIIFSSHMVYQNTKIDKKTNHIKIDRQERDFCDIPFFYCPICGKKSKYNISYSSFYYKFQNK